MSSNRQKCLHELNTYVVLMLIAITAARKQRDFKVPPDEYDENGCLCVWTNWMNNNDYDPVVGDDTTYQNLRKSYQFCENPVQIKCRETKRWYVPFDFLHARNTICNVKIGLKCVSKPFIPVESGEMSYYCNDFEITVLCCSCSQSTGAIVATTDQTGSVTRESTNSTASVIAFSLEQSRTFDTSEHDKTTITSILLPVVGGVVLAGLAITIYLIIRKISASRKDKTNLSFYQEVEATSEEPTALVVTGDNKLYPKVIRAPPSGSSDYLTTTSEDEGYRSRPSYSNRKLKTKRQRNTNKRRMKRSSNLHRLGNTSDSSEFPIHSLNSAVYDPSYNGRSRKWFPDEYERALEQKIARNASQKNKSTFLPSFQVISRKEGNSEIV